MRSAYILLLALQLLFSRFISFDTNAIFDSARLPLPIYNHSRPMPNQYGSLLSTVAMGLNMPLQATIRRTHGEIA